jgi:hypothetical protein
MKLPLSILACAVAITGCGSVPPQGKPQGSGALLDANVVTSLQLVQAKKASEVSDADRQKLEAALEQLQTTCSEKLGGMESESKKKAQNAFWLSVAGAVAGSVVVPALAVHAATNAGAIAGFGGFAGATNFMSQALVSSGNSGSADATTRNQIVAAIQAKLTDAFNEQKTIGERLTAIDAARAACVFYSIYVPSVTTYTAPGAAGGK